MGSGPESPRPSAQRVPHRTAMSRIYLSAPHMGDLERRYVDDAFAMNWISSVGPNLDGFERELGELLGGHVVALASGTAALHLGLRLLDVGPGDEVLCPTLTFAASANPIVYQSARPVFLDAEACSYNLDPEIVETTLRARAKAGKKTKALVL